MKISCNLNVGEGNNNDFVDVNQFVETNQIEKNTKIFRLCIETRVPIMLTGPVGSGKTTFIDYMAKSMNKVAYRVQISDETDSKTLLGGYCCTKVTGKFQWRHGPLVTAMKRGYWLVLEDVLSGQSNLLGMLRPLLEAESLGLTPKICNINQSNEEIVAHDDFRIIVTQSLLELEDGYRELKFGGGSPYITNCLNKCQTILIDKLSPKSIETIVKSNYPGLTTFMQKIIGEQGIVNLVIKQSSGKEQSRMNSPRDLFKFCQRISNVNRSDEKEAICYFLDAVDSFMHHIPDVECKNKLLFQLGSVFNLNQTDVEHVLKHRVCKIRGHPIHDNVLHVGRVELKKKTRGPDVCINAHRSFAQTRQMSQLLETLARCVQMKEPVLLISETGCGKTSTVQYLSKLVNTKLIVINMNQQSDSSDLLGGYKPVSNAISEEDNGKMEDQFNGLVQSFCQAFKSTFDGEKNKVFLNYINEAHSSRNYELLLNLTGSDAIHKGVKALPTLSEPLKADWENIVETIDNLRKELKQTQCSLTLSYIEGALVQAIRNGDWVLLDEINLAPPEMLQSLSGLLESSLGSVILTERGDEHPVPRHADFRLFACMNPATDVGKRNLPQGLRNRFTEVYLHELTNVEELSIIVKYYLGNLKHQTVECVVQLYLALRAAVVSNMMIDGGGQKPQFSLRTLCRALEEIDYIRKNELYNATIIRSLYEGFSFSFKCQLGDESRDLFDKLFHQHFRVDMKNFDTSSILTHGITQDELTTKHIKVVMGYPIKIGSVFNPCVEETDEFVKGYKITKSISKNLRDLSRIVSSGKSLPVLIQGETSVGKTSLITYLAKLTGHICHRVNNHEATDIQEYIGSYVHENADDSRSKFVFKEGVLAQAMRHGHWIILDELNLAPTDILEALNRVLDDNRELFIVETQTTIKAHPMFRLFATQNPPGQYGGRKALSRALKNRFIELHFNPIPNIELVDILHESCRIPKTRGKIMVEAMRRMQLESPQFDVNHCKRTYVSLRDLFRWARRVYQQHDQSNGVQFDWNRTMVEEGYLLLTGKARSIEEVQFVARVLSSEFKVQDMQLNDEWFFSTTGSNIARSILERCAKMDSKVNNIEWTFDFRRIAILLIRALQCNEPTLLVGNTGCGKTTICQLAALLNNQQLLTLNCHMNTEASDFLGGLRPASGANGSGEKLFQWVDGPLVTAMKHGNMFLIDEISLAEDSVLERLNSVLERDRKLTLVENNERDMQSVEIMAHPSFQVVATMNPGGDFGKKELSPALKNRFTEIWCPSNSWNTTDSGRDDWVRIAAKNLSINNVNEGIDVESIAKVIVEFLRRVHAISHEISFAVITIRDLLAWVNFINISLANGMEIYQAILHAAYMVVIDSINDKLDKASLEARLVGDLNSIVSTLLPSVSIFNGVKPTQYQLSTNGNRSIGIDPFFIEFGPYPTVSMDNYSFSSTTTAANLYRLLRALQIGKKPLLLEGSPGVGKTSLVSQLAKMAGYGIVRINLSEQTDANDLFGCFLPIDNGEAGQLSWRDGPLLLALKRGDWILLDEMNLASQSVLECLNACLDHRGEIFIPELNQSFAVQPGRTRLFACQNPLSEGSGRKGLPKSFINRFTQVYMSSLLPADYRDILTCLYPAIDTAVIEFMVTFVHDLQQTVSVEKCFGAKGSPWEFNLRDLCRWGDLMVATDSREPARFVQLLFTSRFRTTFDQQATIQLYNRLADQFGMARTFSSPLDLSVVNGQLQLGQAHLSVRSSTTSQPNHINHLLLPGQLSTLESIMLTIQMGWLTILVGPSGTGKTSLVHLLAQMTGNKLRSMSMNSAMDTSDLLGSFEQQSEGGRFRWVDSALVQSLKTGDWLILDTVNFSSASVLDRLNGLLEPNGSLLLTERGMIDGDRIEEVRPHSSFRLFLILDPDCGGEISKAMRNRGLEIAVFTENREMPLIDTDIELILIAKYQISIAQATSLVRFHKMMVDAKNASPQIKVGNINSLLQAGRLIQQGCSLEEALSTVYGDGQFSFDVRSDVYRFITTCEHEEDDDHIMDESFPIITMDQLISNPLQSQVMRHKHALKKTIQQLQSVTFTDKCILARMFMQYSSTSDLQLRLDSTVFDTEINLTASLIAKTMSQYPSIDKDIPIDYRWLPNWSEFRHKDVQSINKMLFALCNMANHIDTNQCQSVASLKPSEINKNLISQLNVLQISSLINSGRLSRGLISQFDGLDKSTSEFINLFISMDISQMSNDSQIYRLINACQLFKSFVLTGLEDSNHWISTYVYHVSAILDHLTAFRSDMPNLFQCGQQILDKLHKLDLNQYSDIVDRDNLVINRNELRLKYPHSQLIKCYEQYQQVVTDTVTPWKPIGEEEMKKVLKKVFLSFVNLSEPDSINELVNHFDIESVRIWPLMMTLFAQVLHCTSVESLNQLNKFLTDFSSMKHFLPPLPCNLQDNIAQFLQNSDTHTKLITLTDYVSYIISQGPLNKILASSSYKMDSETDEYSIALDFDEGFIQPQIDKIWHNPDNAIFLLINGSQSKADVLSYFNNINTISISKRCLRSVKTRQTQLSISKQLYVECSAVLTSNQLRINREMKLLSDLTKIQRACITGCWNGDGTVNSWLDTHFPWFVSLERDIENMSRSNGNHSLSDIGKLSIRWGSIQMKLFALMESLDPQSHIYWENKYLQQEHGQLTRQKELGNVYRTMLTGIKQSEESERCWSEEGLEHPLLSATVHRLKALKKNISKLSTSIGLRPVGDDKYKKLRIRTLRFLSKYGWNVLCDESLNVVSSFDTSFAVEWSMACANLLDYFLENSNGLVFPDLIEPLALGISRILTGLDLIERCKPKIDKKSESVLEICRLFCQFPNCNVLNLIETILNNEKEIMNHCRVLIGGCSGNILAKIHIKLLHLSLRMLNYSQNIKISDEKRRLSLLHRILSVFDGLWMKQQKKQQEKEEAEASMYVQKQIITKSLTDDEIENLEIFIQFCPIMESADEAMKMSASMNAAASKIQKLREQLNSMGAGLVLSDETIHSIVNLTGSILHPEKDQIIDNNVFRDCYRFAAALINSNHDNMIKDASLFAAHTAALSWEYDSLSSTNVDSCLGKPYNIYQDPVDVKDIIQAQQTLDNLLQRLSKLLEMFPEHSTLLQIERKANNILNLSLQYPLIVFINNIERLIYEIQQWEVVAARHVSLNKNVDELNEVLVQWRHQELKMWENTLITTSWKTKSNVSQEFFNYYNLILAESAKHQYENDFESINVIIDPILMTLTKSTVGNYQAKLHILRLLVSSVKSLTTVDEKFRTRLGHILQNHYDYYNLYSGNIEEHLTSEYNRIGKELKGFIKTKKWGSTAPKVTDVVKCHKIVFKYNRQWTTVNNQPCSTFMILNPINALKQIFFTNNPDYSNMDFSNSGLSDWSKNLLEYSSEMWKTMENFQKETKELEEIAAVDAKSNGDLAILEKKWRSNVKNLQQRKRNCVTNFVKELKQLGLTLHGSNFTRETALMNHLPLGDVRKAGDVSTIRCVSLRLQLDDSNKSEEFTKFNEFKDRLISACDHLLVIACSNTVKINVLHEHCNVLKQSIQVLSNTMKSEIVSSTLSSNLQEQLTTINAENKEKLEQWRWFLNILKKSDNSKPFPSMIADHMKPSILCDDNNWESSINEIMKKIDDNIVPDSYLITEEHRNCLTNHQSINDSIHQLIEMLNEKFSPDHMNIKSSVTNGFVVFNRSNQQKIHEFESIILQSMNFSSSSNSAMKIIETLPVIIGENLQKFKSILSTNFDELTFSKINAYLDSLELSLDHENINTMVNELKTAFLTMSKDEINELKLKLKESILPILEQMALVTSEFIAHFYNYHDVVIGATDGLLTIIAKLMKDGFCSPNDAAWQKSEENSCQNEKINDFDMAGMDDGVGANDVSDQIESESQIEGHDKNKDVTNPENMDDIPDQENGIEMSEDFEGKMHDPEVDESNEKEKEDDNMKDLEDKMGDVGDAPETDVNKESWDEKENEQEEEDGGKREDSRKGGVPEENTTEMVADDHEEGQSNEQSKKKDVFDDFDQAGDNNEENIKPMDETNTDNENGENPSDLCNDEQDVKEMPLPEENAIDHFWNDDEQFEDEGQENKEQSEEIEVDPNGHQEDGNNTEEDTIDDLKPVDENYEEFSKNEIEQVDVAGFNAGNEDKDMTYDTELGEETTEHDNSVNGNGGGSNNSASADNNGGNVDQNQATSENKDPSTDQKQDPASKPSDNRTLGDIDKSFKRKTDVLENNDNSKRPRLNDACSHIDNQEAEDSSDQILDDATAKQQQHIPEINDEEILPEQSNDFKEPNDPNPLQNKLDVTKFDESKDTKMQENKDKKENPLKKKEKPMERYSWSHYEAKSEYLARELCENLRIVLEPTKANKLGGAFRTGKRLNMKKIIPYIASGFLKDKIWLKRNKASQREYQVIIGVDNSESMAYNVNHQLFFESLSIVLNGLTFLEVGQVGLCKFGAKTDVVLPLNQQFSSEIGEQLVRTFDFSDKCSKFIPLLDQSLRLFEENREHYLSSSSKETSQLLLLLSDGALSEDVSDPKLISLIREAYNKNIFVVVILLDTVDTKSSITNLQWMTDDGMNSVRFLDVFPLRNYTVLQDVTKLPTLLTDILRQWFELVSSVDKGPGR